VICVVDASVAVKWFVTASRAGVEDHVGIALDILVAATRGEIDLLAPPHFMAEVAAVLARISPTNAQADLQDLSLMDFTWATPDQAISKALTLAQTLNHHLFDTLYHALALETPGAVLVTADRRYFDKARHLGQIEWLADFRLG
jgi:predicted nucleic acid-binding protein